ncbi:FtsX-like permease family protein [Streptomyces fulvorobeus]|uniref:ABC3 transporter permease C-terminal domain-containing protein n=1 Tax=Streptomyces fulvorobeus TaxID=284028 RepID=A0A7J0CFA1_9ACTN|nr:FtsX-like permease family protein [Streptomyces fulvorobeus]NYE44633.1 hypothetical protein [Streptomyces fulvorobeus]GFN01181.1 hypothetical protein Sfulv_59910 [Streptomyces fulvorobeus]
MIRLVLGYLIDNLRIWLGAALSAAVTAVVGAIAASDIQTATEIGGTAGLALYGISGTVILLSALTSVVVLGSITNLAVALHQRSYALWQLVGLGPHQVRTVVQAQLAHMALIGGAAGCAVAVPLLRLLLRRCAAPAGRDAGIRSACRRRSDGVRTGDGASRGFTRCPPCFPDTSCPGAART